MKKTTNLLLLLFSLASIFASCKKEKMVEEIDKLPAATQNGANTFGCLVNGKAWIAQHKDCSIICDETFKVSYNGNYGGIIGITGDWLNRSKNINQRIEILVDSTNFKSLHILSLSVVGVTK